ncbi:SemiSWEET family transporter [Sphingomonas sp. Leaf343]|uniref:SemiSWEET family transporter n=1 Tax=Sphingomonas sp. Leaf343 TaxID=1736345 RepID=UPI0022A8DD66
MQVSPGTRARAFMRKRGRGVQRWMAALAEQWRRGLRQPDTRPFLTERTVMTLGWIATAAPVTMYVSYVDQIRLNLSGEKGSMIQPLATVVNCSLWAAYGFLRHPKRDWPIVLANAPGIVLGALSLATAF